MRRWINRLLLLAIVGGVTKAALDAMRARRSAGLDGMHPDTGRRAEWPSFEPGTHRSGASLLARQVAPQPTAVTSDPDSDSEQEQEHGPKPRPQAQPLPKKQPEEKPKPERDPKPKPGWLPPSDGTCPPGYPIKANDSSRIYHVPGGRFYDRTIPERCYATEAAAERDGYRRSKA